MPRKLTLNEIAKRRTAPRMSGSPEHWTPRKGLLKRGRGVNIISAWDLPAWQLEDLERRLLIAQDSCFYSDPDIILPRAGTPCREWCGFEGEGPWLTKDGLERNYGLVQIDKTGFVPMHQLAYRLAGFPALPKVPGKPERILAHRCDNKKCCNPQHLRWATKAENAQDIKISKAVGDYTPTPYAEHLEMQREIKKQVREEPETVAGFFEKYYVNKTEKTP